MLTKEQILSKAGLQTKIEHSDVFEDDFCLQELTRASFRAVVKAAKVPPNDDSDEEMVDKDLWNGGLFAAVVVDQETRAPLFTLDEILEMAHRADVWNEILRIATIALNFSEIGPEALKKTSSD